MDRLLELLRTLGIRRAALGTCIFCETLLLLIALIPQSIWSSLGYPSGPIPDVLAPVVAGAFYLLPALTGALCRRWKLAVVLATLPAWLDLGMFAIAAAGHIGPFYLAIDPHAVNTVGTLELFAVLGALGWLAQSSLRSLLKSPKRKRQ
ncbi:MAG TPA: hypothetical protein VKT82_25590 [Ktedonobacterales bacterium]|nr:hypothetical protein [Ktedonobacterales bacterium]